MLRSFNNKMERFRLGRIIGRYLLLEIFLCFELDDIQDLMFKTSILGRKYLTEMRKVLEKRLEEEHETDDWKRDSVKVNLNSSEDWEFMKINYSKFRRPMNYEVIANSFEDAVVFMGKVASK